MASITSLMNSSSSSSSIYGNRTNNMITGLASGMDTEAMIEGMVQGYQQKILKLQQNKTMVQWQQAAYQSISDKLVEFSRKYMSYSQSTTNLMSPAFFNNAVITTAKGEYANMITATGKSSSNIVINSVNKLASAANSSNSADNLSGVNVGADGKLTITSEEKMQSLGENINLSTLEGSLSLKWGSRQVTINFGELEFFDQDGTGNGTVTAEQLKDAIEKKLGDTQMVNAAGETVNANELIKVSVDGSGNISFEDNTSAGNKVYISGASGKLKDTLGLADEIEDEASSFHVKTQSYTETMTRAEYLSDESIQVSLNGVTKTISLKDVLKPNEGDPAITDIDKFKENLNTQLDKAFGAGQVTADFSSKGNLEFTVNAGSTLSVQSTMAEVMGFDGGLTTYLNTSKTLKDIGSFNAQNGELILGGVTLKGTATKTELAVTQQDDGTYRDAKGALVDKDGFYLNEDGEKIYEYSLQINDETLTFNQDSTVEKIISTINSSDAGVEVSFSKTTNQFNLTAKETGSAGRIEIAENGLAGALFGKVNEKGDDAVFTATINGKTTTYTRSSNTVELDGLTITLEGTFNQLDTSATTAGDLGIKGSQLEFEVEGKPITLTGITSETTVAEIESQLQEALGNGYTLQYDPVKKGYQVFRDGTEVAITAKDDNANAKAFLSRPSMDADGEGVTFSSKTDTDAIVDVIKQMITDYNAIVTEVKKAYSDMPLQKSDGSKYEPLTAEDEADMTESEIKAYEEKAKTGILFMDRELSSLYSALRGAVVGDGDPAYLREIGISTSYEEGLTTITLDENKLRQALETDLDGVRDAFTKTGENGNGLMASIQEVTDRYASTTGATKGILIEKAGSKYATTSALNNTMQEKLEDLDEQIARWQDKMSNKVDYYTNKFTQLEVLINQMNAQSSALAGLTGGY